MKTLSVFAKPAILVILFCFLLISGENTGGFYLLYLLLGFPHAALYSLFGFLGVGLLIVSSYRFRQRYTFAVEPIFNIAGIVLMIFSLVLFFVTDKTNYNNATFVQTAPMFLLLLFALLALNFILINIIRFYTREST